MTSPENPKNPTRPTAEQAARFLMQATLGATSAEIHHVTEVGFENWIDEQFALPPSVTFEEARQVRNAGGHFELHHAWWRQVLNAPDLLRQRLATALSEIFVVSEMSIEFLPWEMLEYYDDLARLCSGNWRDLLRHVTLDPIMGYYLSHLKNRKADPALQRFPDENYAREIMQLFSIGLWELNPDGTRRRDAQGREIPTYDNATVANFARVFTGLAFGGVLADVTNREQFLLGVFDPFFFDYSVSMKMWEDEHDRDEKVLLRGLRLPAFSDDLGRKGMDDVEDALENLFLHPNVGPFFGRLLIQRLVTSNPSPGYVERVTKAFVNNGRAVRGDMRAVVKAILLDPEAREAPLDGVGSGRLREPYYRQVWLARSFQARAATGEYFVNDHDTLKATGQLLFNSPTVFNFFLPDYQPPGMMAEAGLYGPEFQILTSSTAITSLNSYMRSIAVGFGDDPDGPRTMRLNFEEEIRVAHDPEALLDLLGLKMTSGALTPEVRRILIDAYRELPASYSAEEKVKTMAQLIVVSPDFAVAH